MKNVKENNDLTIETFEEKVQNSGLQSLSQEEIRLYRNALQAQLEKLKKNVLFDKIELGAGFICTGISSALAINFFINNSSIEAAFASGALTFVACAASIAAASAARDLSNSKQKMEKNEDLINILEGPQSNTSFGR